MLGDECQFAIEGVLEDVLVDIPHQIKSGISAAGSALRRIPHRSRSPGPPETLPRHHPISMLHATPVHIGDGGQIGEYPDTVSSAVDDTLGLIGMDERSACNLFEDATIRRFVLL